MASITGDSATTPSEEHGWRQTCREFVHYIPDGHSIPEASWRTRHRNILILVLAQLPFLFALGVYEGTESVITGATAPAIPLSTVLFELGIVTLLAVASLVPREATEAASPSSPTRSRAWPRRRRARRTKSRN